jgi:hypothetical protein
VASDQFIALFSEFLTLKYTKAVRFLTAAIAQAVSSVAFLSWHSKCITFCSIILSYRSNLMDKLSSGYLKLACCTLASALSVYNTTVVAAETAADSKKDWTAASGLLDAAGINLNETSFMKNLGLTVGGWVNGSVSANFNGSDDRFNGPVTFNDRTGEVQLNQAYLWLQKPVTVGGDKFDWGFRADFMYGTDAIFTQAYGVPTFDPRTGEATRYRGNWDLHLSDRSDRFYGIALPQAYAEFNLPFGNGIDVKVGHFYTTLGYEVVTAPDNMFITHAYTMQYGEPFTHTGILGSYTFNPNWSISAGAVTGSSTGGWDGGFNKQLGNWAFLGGFTWTSDDTQSSVAINSTAGHRSEQFNDAWAMYSLVAKHNFTDKLHYVFQHDHGFADNVLTAQGLKDASWYGINQYLTYDVDDKVTVGMRAEWFRDANGFRVAAPGRCGAGLNADTSGNVSSYSCPAGAVYPFAASNYYAITGGVTYKPAKWLALRSNLRYDYADIKAFDSGDRRDQLLFTVDTVISF